MSKITQVSPVRYDDVDSLDITHLVRIQLNAGGLKSKAMQLTDAWGQAMFILDRRLVEKIFTTLGFSTDIVAGAYDCLRSLGYVHHDQLSEDTRPEVTWHIIDATCLTLRGATQLGDAMNAVDDESIEGFLQRNIDLFESLMGILPNYSRDLMFSPEVAATVMTCLGASVSADKLYELARTYGRQVTIDLEGRRGVSTQFIRSLTLTISARI